MPRHRFQGFETITPAGWGLPWPLGSETAIDRLDITVGELLDRVRQSVYGFVLGLYDEEVGALRHFYRADTRQWGAFDSGNFLMALNFVVAADVFNDPTMLERASRCFHYAVEHFCETHPMAFWQGGVRDGQERHELWLKYTGDAMWLAQALYRRTRDPSPVQALQMFHSFCKRAREAGYRYVFDRRRYQWRDVGNVWRAFGFPVTAYLELYELTGEERYRQAAIDWGGAGLTLQADDGLFYLIDGVFWNSDLTAPELRGLVYLWEVTGVSRYLDAAVRFADQVVKLQRADGSWPLGVDRDGEVSIATIGPGDAPNIALSLIRLHGATGDDRYLDAATKAVRYGMQLQALPGGKYPLWLDDPHVCGGFWSWDPLYDHTLSGDQSIHHIRGMLFLASYLDALT